MSDVVRITMPKAPPSVNNMWRAFVRWKKGKPVAVNILTAEGRIWQDESAHILGRLNHKGLGDAPGYWRADILIPGAGATIDIDNYLKGILDAIGAAGLTPDDRYLCDLRIRFHDGDKVSIAIKREELTKWAKIRKASKSTIQKLARSMTSDLGL